LMRTGVRSSLYMEHAARVTYSRRVGVFYFWRVSTW
jgi:hypothetical protein